MICDRLPMRSVPQCGSLLKPLVSEEDGSQFEDKQECAGAAAGGGGGRNRFGRTSFRGRLVCLIYGVHCWSFLKNLPWHHQVMCSNTSWWGLRASSLLAFE